MGIYAIVDASLTSRPDDLLRRLLEGGIKLVQYRSKVGVDRSLVRALHAQTVRAGALLVVNDDLEAALDADGVHLGQEDIAGRELAALRARLEGRLLGISCGSAAEVRDAALGGADYAGVGPFAVTTTKPDAGPALGEPGVRAIVAAASMPVAAIGGIGLDDLPAVARTGAAMAAVASALSRAADPAATARAFITRWNEVRT